MNLRASLVRVSRSLAIRIRPSTFAYQPRIAATVSSRGYADDLHPLTRGRHQNFLGNVNEEAAHIGRVTGETQPELGQGTLVKDILKREEKSRNNAPSVIKEELSGSSASASLISTTHTPNEKGVQNILNAVDASTDPDKTLANLLALGQLQKVSGDGSVCDPVTFNPQVDGHKFGLPDLPIPKDGNFKYRENPIVSQVTNLLMRDGKKSVAQRNMSFILNALRTAAPPVPSPLRPLLPGHPPPHHLPLDPVAYLALAIDSVAPLIRIRSQKGAAGGGAALQIPVPLGLRQRRRQAVMWILESVNKRKCRGSGRGMFAQRFADEIINVIEGKSAAWEKRHMIHKIGTTARSNLNYGRRRR